MWKLSLAKRIRTGAALAVVFLLVLATNRMDSNHFIIVQKSLTTVYEDRLLAKDYIYKISRQLQIKKNIIYNGDMNQIEWTINMANDSIDVLVYKFSQTELTETEALRFESFQNNLNELNKLEQNLSQVELINEELPSLNVREDRYSQLYEELDILSKIQLDEAKREISHSTRTINASNLISRLEIGALIIIGLLIQMLIFFKPLR
ncbi:hypothetical protein [Ekhidna sp.]|uniref:hypothetical protein n=1 Tax=Ekhidna sp. TaxID=2608089 RepID=UPI0032978290